MAVEINIPKLGMAMKEATLVEWKFNEGDHVDEGDVILEIETEKTTWEVEAPGSGFLHILVSADTVQPVGAAVGLIAKTQEELAGLPRGATSAPKGAAPSEEAPAVAARKAAEVLKGKEGRIKISPLARKMAEKNGIDPGTLTGTGPGGRITKKDLEKAIAAREAGPAAPKATGVVERDGKKIKEVIPLKRMRKLIAEHMHHSLSVSAQLTSMYEMDVTELKKLRAGLVAQEEHLGVRISFNDIYVLAVAKTLKDFPMINASLIDGEIIIWKDINVGVAVAMQGADDLGGGLIVPVVRNADQKKLSEISKELKNTISKAREGKLLPDDVSCGTFTVSNMGAISGGGRLIYGTPIINQPESAILVTGAIVDRPVVVDGEIVIRPMMPLSLTFDHRMIDGVPADMFMGQLIKYLSNPTLMLS